ncbi:tripartite tricarboxylate transporter TctB family protein [Fusobacterium sp. PH5-44]|uniref:tripartite tricarboxylate transporter TctB family protein n=1 Tax=unclassified Fusobacterium TaxID=2648384 RepID=UPI003D1D0B33
MKKANIISGLIFMCISIYVIVVTFTFKKFKNVPVGPEFFPRYLGIGLLICSVIIIFQGIVDESKAKAPTISPFDKGIQRVIISLAIMVFYVILWPILGFLIVTPLLLFFLMCLLKIKNYAVMIAISVIASVMIFSIFKYLLGIEMPLGILQGIIK